MPRARTCSSFSRCRLIVCLICARHTSSRIPPISSPRRSVRPLLKRMNSLPGSALISATEKPCA